MTSTCTASTITTSIGGTGWHADNLGEGLLSCDPSSETHYGANIAAAIIFLVNCHVIQAAAWHDYAGAKDYSYSGGAPVHDDDDGRVTLEKILQSVRMHSLLHHEMAYEQLQSDSYTVQKINIINAELSQNSSSSITERIIRQRFLLTVFYLDTDGDNWTFCSANGGYCGSIPWLSGLHDHCSWYGIGCDSSDLVSSIDVQDNNLRGTLQNSTLFDETFSSIATINLSANRLHALADNIDNLKNLKKLDLDHNYFHGEIPSSIYNLPDLRILDLHANKFMGTISPAINRLQNVETILLHENNLSGEVPEEYLELSKLSTFKLQHNQFENEIPCDVSSLQSRVVFADCPVFPVSNGKSWYEGVTCDCCAQCFFEPGADTALVPSSAPIESSAPSSPPYATVRTNHPTLSNGVYSTKIVEKNTSGSGNNHEQALYGIVAAGALLALFGVSIVLIRKWTRNGIYVLSKEECSSSNDDDDFLGESAFDDELPEWVMPPPPSLEEAEEDLEYNCESSRLH
eukprot:CAMPEP_0116022812 /NCGR_PEP_ID=MMETSP0321-20121206/11205_1 /TAXON_ID=163516 /ORGANISM="Leptocylindrus danicus var. danicus, Strain B650" /LENGTH=514 /DNA_ID=CAMNT_0003493945 /DNA_START=139 /DNA_END=1684 /DNA_ORIENTATION=+